MVLPSNHYLDWRANRSGVLTLADHAGALPPEALLQQVWLYQRLLPEKLQTPEGTLVKILHPGFWNREPGPDFRKAVIQIGSDAPVTGDVEIDLVAAGWEQHSHAGNPSYRNVVLHVTWEPGRHRHLLPTIAIKGALDSTISDLAFWLGVEPKPLAEGLAGQCSGPFQSLNPTTLAAILKQAAQARLRSKAEQLQARARQVGWEGALWEGLFAALGYKRNTWPMRRIAELLPTLLACKPDSPSSVQALLMGIAGLLPAELPKTETVSSYFRNAWDAWWREADRLREHQLPASLWALGGIRPANHPQRRLALAAHWVSAGNLPARIEGWLARKIESPDLQRSLSEILQIHHDPFWSYRWTLNSKPFLKPQPLIGEQRITDIAMNVILPWLYVRALAGKNDFLAETAEARYFQWEAGEDNAVLKLARNRLFGGMPAHPFKTAAQQQALLQITRDFCDHSNAACDHCPFPGYLNTIAARPNC